MASYRPEHAARPGTISALRGVIFQSDGKSSIGRLLIRPFEAFDRCLAGILPRPGELPLAMHAGLHVEIDGRREFVAEQLVGTFYMDLRNGLNWTPIDVFRQRDRGGWDVTVPATAFRRLDQATVDQTVGRLNRIEGHPFMGEDCTAFIERAFGGPRLFADSPILSKLGIAVRVGDPALPLLEPDAPLDDRARRLLQFDAIRDLPDAIASADAPNARVWTARLVPLALLAWLAGSKLADRYSSGSRRSRSASSTARRFFK